MANPYVPLDSLIPFLSITDPRRQHPSKAHHLIDCIAIAILGTLCSAQNWVEIEHWAEANLEWLQTFLELPNGVPSHDTLCRVFSLLDPDELQQAFIEWISLLVKNVEGVIALDGKSVRRSLGASDRRGPLHLVSAFAAENGLVLAQLRVDDKENEIVALPKLIKLLNLKNCVVTIDAMGCQTDIAKAITDRGGDFVLQVKGNQPTLLEDISSYFERSLDPALPADQARELCEFEATEKGHGRVERRTCRGSNELDVESVQRFAAKSVWMVESERQVKGSLTIERRYFISSFDAEKEGVAQRVAEAIRYHWRIENQVHWLLDVAMGEDQNRTREGFGAENLALIRKMVLNVVKQDKTVKGGVQTKLKRAGWDVAYRLLLMGKF